MAKYILLSRLTDMGRKTLKERAERILEVNTEVESMGARVTEQLALMGQYDFITVIDAPTNEVTARMAVELGSRGTIEIVSMPAQPIDEFVEQLKGSAVGGD